MQIQLEVNDDIIIALPEAFNIEANLGYLARVKIECMYEIEDNIITRVTAIGDVQSLVQISVANNTQMVVHFLKNSKPTEKRKKERIVKYIRVWFDLDNDLTSFYAIAKNDPLLKMPVETFYGL